MRPLSRIAQLFRNAKKPARPANRPARFALEHLEDRSVPANFTITGTNLSISLNVNETLTVTDTGANTTFVIDNGNFSQVGGDNPVSGAGTQTLVVTDAQLSDSLTINNAAATANTDNTVNGVIFSGTAGDTLASTTISVSIADADMGGDVDNINFNGLQLNSATGAVSISTANGSITSNNAATNDVTASTLTLTASALIGAAGSPLQTTIANVEASAPGTNGINIRNTTSAARPDLTIGGTDATLTGITSGGPVSVVSLFTAGTGDLNVGEGVTAAGNIFLSADGNLNVTAAVSSTGTGTTVTAAADTDNSGAGNITTSNQGTITTAGGAISIGPGGVANGGAQVITLGNAVTVNGGAGGITVQAESDANINAALAVTTAGSGGITVIADFDNGDNGNITSNATGTITTAGGAISIGASAGGIAQVVTLGGAVTVNGGAGDITVTADENINVNAALAVAMSGTGGIAINGDFDNDATGDITTTAAGTIGTAGGAISIGGTGAQVAQVVTLGGSVTVNGGSGGITVTGENNVFVNAPVAIATGGAGGILVTADSDNNASGDITTTAAISTTGGNILIGGPTTTVGAQNTTIGGSVTVTGGSGQLTVVAENTLAVNAALSVTGTGNILITGDNDNSGAGDVTTTATLDTAGGSIGVGTGAGGPPQNVTLGGAVTVTGSSGSISVAAEASANINAALSVTGSGDISVAADTDNSGAGDITTTAAISTQGGNISVGGTGAAVAQVVTLGGAVTVTGGSGGITVLAETNANINAALGVTGTGGITVTADNDVNSSGDFSSSAAGTVSTTSGSIAITGVNVSISGAVASTGGGNITILGTSGTGGDVNINAGSGVTASGGNGNILIQADVDSDLNATVSANGTGTITYDTDLDATGTGDLQINNGGGLVTAGGNITFRGQDLDIINGAINATTGATSRVSLLTRDLTDSIQLGTDVGFGLTDADLDQITAGILQIGSAATNTAGIQTTGQITLAPALVPVLRLETAGAFVDSTGGEQTDVTVQSLAVLAENGIGSGVQGDAGDIDVAVTNLAAANTNNGTAPTGDINIFNTGALSVAQNVDGLVGVTNDAPSGNVTIGADSSMTINALVSATGGGNINLFTTGTSSDITLLNDGRVAASGGNGNVSVTAGGSITVNDTTTAPEVQAAGSGSVTLSAGSGVTLSPTATGGNNVTVQSDTGLVQVLANVGNATGTADILLDTNSSVRTAGNIIVSADQNGVGTAGGGMVTMNTGTQLSGVGAGRAASIQILGGEDVLVTTALATGNITVSTATALNDDSVESTLLDTSTGNIFLTAGGRIGSAISLTTAEIVAATGANYLAMVDVAYSAAGTLNLNQVNTLGNIQVRKVGGTLITGNVIPGTPLIGSGNQLTLVSTGPISVANNFTLADGNLFIATAETPNDITFTATGSITNNGSMSTSTLLAGGGAGAAIVTTGPNDTTANFAGNNLVLSTTGGAVGSVAVPLEIDARSGNLSGNTTLGGATGGDFFVTDTLNGLRVGQVNAGTGAATLRSLANNGTTSNINAVTPNDNVAEVIASTVTLDTSTAAPPVPAPNGQIGGPNLFFEVDADVINASTNNSRAWIAAVDNGALGLINTGTATAFLRASNGATVTNDADALADVLAPTVNLSNGTGGGSFGTLGAEIQIDATTLVANLANTGSAFVQDLAGTNGVGLVVQQGTATTGDIGILVDTGDLTLGNGAGPTSTVSASGTATLTATTGAISGAGTTDVTAASLAATALNGVGSSGNALITVLGNLAATDTNSGVFVNNTGALVIGTVSGVTGVSGPAVTISNAGSTTVNQAVTATTGAASLTDTGSITSSAAVNATTTAALNAGTSLTTNAGGTISANAVDLDAGSTMSIGGVVASTTTVTADAGTNLATTAAITAGTSATLNATAGTLSAGANVTATAGSASLTAGTSLTASGNVSAGTGASLQAGTSLTTTGTVTGGTTAGLTALGGALSVGGTVTAGTSAALQGTSVTNTAAVAANGGTATVTSTAGAVNVNANVSGSTGTTITATDTATTGQDVTIGVAATVGTGNAPVAILAGDNLTVSGTIVSGTGVTTLTSDAADADAGTGTTVTVTGTLTSSAPVVISGGTDPDTFNITPQTGAAINLDGAAPTMLPGDSLLLNTTGATPVVFTPGMAAGSGSFAFGGGRQAITFTGIENAALATVTILATDAAAAESSGTPNPGQFTLTRTGDTTSALTVNVLVTGSASNGVDYTAIPSTVTFAAGSATATITVDVLSDSLTEGTETVIVTIAPASGTGLGYVVGAMNNSATVNITDNPPPPPAPQPAPPVYTSAAIINGVLLLGGPGGSASAAIPVPPGSSVLFADVTGDGQNDVILFVPGVGVVGISGQTGVIFAFGSDINGDQVPDLLIFNPVTGAPRSFTDGRTGITVPLGN